MIHTTTSSPGSIQYFIWVFFLSIAEYQKSQRISQQYSKSFSKRCSGWAVVILSLPLCFITLLFPVWFLPAFDLQSLSWEWVRSSCNSLLLAVLKRWNHSPMWLTHCLSHLTDIWLTHWRTLHTSTLLARLEQLHERAPALCHPQFGSPKCLGQSAIFGKLDVLYQWCLAEAQPHWPLQSLPTDLESLDLPNKSNISFFPTSLSCTQDPSLSASSNMGWNFKFPDWYRRSAH